MGEISLPPLLVLTEKKRLAHMRPHRSEITGASIPCPGEVWPTKRKPPSGKPERGHLMNGLYRYKPLSIFNDYSMMIIFFVAVYSFASNL